METTDSKETSRVFIMDAKNENLKIILKQFLNEIDNLQQAVKNSEQIARLSNDYDFIEKLYFESQNRDLNNNERNQIRLTMKEIIKEFSI